MDDNNNNNIQTSEVSSENTQQLSAAEDTGSKTEVDLSQIEVVSNGQQVDLTEGDKPKGEEPEKKPEETPTKKEGESSDTNETTDKDIQETRQAMDNAKATLEAKGVDYAKLEAEYNKNGGLSEDSYKVLKDAGYDREIVDAVIAGWQAKADRFYDAVINTAGGEEAYKSITKFVSSQGQAAVDSFNEIVNNANLSTISSYIAGVKAQMTAKYGTANPTLTGGGVVNKPAGFSDQNEMIKAMQDKRYGRDAKYTKEVEKKLAESNFWN